MQAVVAVRTICTSIILQVIIEELEEQRPALISLKDNASTLLESLAVMSPEEPQKIIQEMTRVTEKWDELKVRFDDLLILDHNAIRTELSPNTILLSALILFLLTKRNLVLCCQRWNTVLLFLEKVRRTKAAARSG